MKKYYTYENETFIPVEKKRNDRYPLLNKCYLNFFIAGDKRQFLDELNFNNDDDNEILKKSKSIDDLMNTFEFIFDRYKKGCFLQFSKKKLVSFVPFSKVNYLNDIGHKLKVNPKFADCTKFEVEDQNREYVSFKSMIKEMNENTKYENSISFERNRNKWYFNNGLLRFEYPINELDNGYNILFDMFQTLQEERDVCDISFFLNKRDFPLLRHDMKEAYHNIYGSNFNLPDKYSEEKVKKYLPILGMNSNDEMCDIAIPTWDCWRIFSFWYDKRIFMVNKNKEFKNFPFPEDFNLNFDQKKPTAVFRGSSTGIGYNEKNNIRLFVCLLSEKNLFDEKDNQLFLDAKITSMNCRPRKLEGEPYINIIDKKKYENLLGESLTPIEQSHYKYIIHLPGHSCAYRLTLEMFFGSVLLIYPSKTHLWFFPMLKPYVHYIPLNDGFQEENILSTIKWCKDNDEKCKEIANNSRKFAEKYLNREYALDFLEKKLNQLAKENFVCLTNSSHRSKEQKMSDFIEKNNQFSKSFKRSIYQKYFIDKDKNLFTYFLLSLEKEQRIKNFLEETVIRKDLIESRNTKIDLHSYQDVYFICKKTKKTNNIHEYFVGNLINRIHMKYPKQLVFTYFSFSDEEHSYLLAEYKQKTETLLDIINKKKLKNFDELIEIWIHTCLLLQVLQNTIGFVHMDLLPWNLLIIVLEEPKWFVYEEIGHRIFTKFLPILIDYESSHVSYKSQSFYNTIPFVLNQFTDIFFLIYKSIENFLKVYENSIFYVHSYDNKVKNTHLVFLNQKVHLLNQIKRIIALFGQKLIQYNPKICSEIETVKKYSKESVLNTNNSFWEIRSYFKLYSKYSILLDNIENLPNNMSPIKFTNYLINRNLYSYPQNIDSKVKISRVQIYNIPCYNSYISLQIIFKIVEKYEDKFSEQEKNYFCKLYEKKMKNFTGLDRQLQIKEKNDNNIYKRAFFNKFIGIYKDEFKKLGEILKQKLDLISDISFSFLTKKRDEILNQSEIFQKMNSLYTKATLSKYNFNEYNMIMDEDKNVLFERLCNLYYILSEEDNQIDIFGYKTRSI